MNHLQVYADKRPTLIAFLGSTSGWFSADKIALAKDTAQFVAAALAGGVSLCALILILPKVLAELRRWVRFIF